jgi:hypothetical protein
MALSEAMSGLVNLHLVLTTTAGSLNPRFLFCKALVLTNAMSVTNVTVATGVGLMHKGQFETLLTE